VTDRPIHKTEFPLFLLNQFILPIIFITSFFMFKLNEMVAIGAGVLFIVAMTNLGYIEYNLYEDRITIIKKNLFFHPKTTLLDLPITRLKDLEFEKGFFDKTVFFASKIALFMGLPGRGKTDNDHIITLSFKDEFTTEVHIETFNFDYRYTNLEDLVKQTKLKIKIR
jgi:hypothetical protein